MWLPLDVFAYEDWFDDPDVPLRHINWQVSPPQLDFIFRHEVIAAEEAGSEPRGHCPLLS